MEKVPLALITFDSQTQFLLQLPVGFLALRFQQEAFNSGQTIFVET